MRKGRVSGMVCLALATVLVLSAMPVAAATINEETTQTWKNSGDTKAHGVFAADVDGDNTTEIVTVGEAYTGPVTGTQAQLRIWTWNGTSLVLEKTFEWTQAPNATVTVAYDVHVADFDDDGDLEIAVVGKTGNATASDWMIRVFTWDGTNLNSYSPGIVNAPGEVFWSVHAANLTGDSKLELITVGDVGGNPQYGGVWLWNFNGSALTYLNSTTWGSNNDISAKGVYADDIDADGTTEFVTAGYYRQNVLQTKQGQLRIWNYANSKFTVEKEDNTQQWAGQTTEWNSVFLGNVDNDNDIEVVICGYGYDNTPLVQKDKGVLKIWTWTGTPPTLGLERDATWMTSADTYCNSVYATNLGVGSLLQIITGGKTDDSGTDYADLNVWNWTGTGANIDFVAGTTWATGGRDTAVNAVYAREVDADNTVEILTGGENYDGADWNAQLRISNLSW